MDSAVDGNPVSHSEEEATSAATNGNDVDTPDVLGFGASGSRDRSNTAKMVVDKGALFYKMDHPRRGVCLILNNEYFSVPNLKDRSGTKTDRDNLEVTFKRLGFEVITRDNLTCSQTQRIVKDVAERDHSDCDCFVMCVLSHGEEGVIFATDAPFKHEMIFGPFTADKCPTLAGKPKLFFLQACQGSRLDSGTTMSTQVDSSPSYKIPVHADFLVAYSTIPVTRDNSPINEPRVSTKPPAESMDTAQGHKEPGFYSWRNTGRGSWFVQALVSELTDSGMLYDLLTILTFVNRRVATEFESNVPGDNIMHAKKQVPYITFMLTRLVKFSFKAPS